MTPGDNFLTLGDMSSIRGSSLQGFSELVEDLGADPWGLLADAAIDPAAVWAEPVALTAFVLLMVVVRGGAVRFAARGSGFDRRESAAMGMFAATGLPIIVAVTSVAVSEGQMTPLNASVLVAGGAITVLVCPLVGQRLLTVRHPDRVSPGSAAGT